MLYKLFLEKKKEDALEKRKNNSVCIFTISISMLLGVFGIFISHYNGYNFIAGYNIANNTATSTKHINQVESIINNNAITDTLNKNIDPTTTNTQIFILIDTLYFPFGTTTPTKHQTDTYTTNLLQTVRFDLLNIITTKPNGHSATTN